MLPSAEWCLSLKYKIGIIKNDHKMKFHIEWQNLIELETGFYVSSIFLLLTIQENYAHNCKKDYKWGKGN